MTTKSAEVATEQLKYQTWILKVPIHCEGCNKKVKKVLHGIDGVYMTEVDSKQHKVTVTGNVEAETLIKKLSRSGKHAELWPENPDKKDNNKSGKSKNNGKQKDHKVTQEDGCGGGNGNNKNPPEKAETDAKNGSDHPPQDNEGEEAGGESPAAAGGGGNGGNKKKKNKKKGENGNPNTGEGNTGSDSGGAPQVDAGSAMASKPDPMPQVEQIPSIHQVYPYQPIYYAAPPPPPPPQAYGVNYNSKYPIVSESYYAPSMQGHMFYSQPARYPPPPPPPEPIIRMYYQNGYDGCDDNAGCSIM